MGRCHPKQGKHMTDKQLLELALEALESCDFVYTLGNGGYQQFDRPSVDKAITAIKEALAQPTPVQEPVAWMRKWAFDGEVPATMKNNAGRWHWPTKFKLMPITENQCLMDDVPVYTTPPAQPEERNFCPRCGKRTRDLTVIHTCTPPQSKDKNS